MRVAVFSDIHADLVKLKKAYEKAMELGADKIYHSGDLVGYGQHPNEVIGFLADKNIEGVMGNFDEAVAFDLPNCGCFAKTKEDKMRVQKALSEAKQLTNEENKRRLRSLPDEIRFKIKDKNILIVHATVFGIAQYLFETEEKEVFENIVEASQADVIVCGHTHTPYHKTVWGIDIINAGSVSYPRYGAKNAGFMLIEFEKVFTHEFIAV